MEYGIVNLNLVPVRKKNNAKSEMISQLFFGETLEVLSKKNNWCLVISNLDNYKGWVRDSHFLSIPKIDYIKINRKIKCVISYSFFYSFNNFINAFGLKFIAMNNFKTKTFIIFYIVSAV